MSSEIASFEGKFGVGLSAYSLVAMLRASLGKPADREEESRSFNKLKARIPELQDLQTVAITRSGREYQTPALVSLTQVHAVIDSKSYSSIAAKFKAQHLDAILTMLPNSGVSTVSRKPLPSYMGSLEGVIRGAGDDRYSGIAPNYPSFQNFLSEMEATEGVHFNMTHREEQGGFLVLTLSCHFGGKPSWMERAGRASKQPNDFKRTASAGHSIKVQCPATITARISKPYARSLGFLLKVEGESEQFVPDKRIPIKMILGHCGHQPNTAMDLNSLPLNSR